MERYKQTFLFLFIGVSAEGAAINTAGITVAATIFAAGVIVGALL